MKTLIAVPAMDTVPTQFCSSMATLNKVGDCFISFNVGSLVYTSRNKLAQTAIEQETDYIFWLDSDMVFNPDILERMMKTMQENNLDFLSGLYFRRVPPYSAVLFDKLDIADGRCEWSNFEEIPTGLFKAGGVGFGCVLMKTDVAFDVFSKYLDMFSPLANVGEDLSFCWRARQCGYDIWVDPSITLGHVGHAIITKEFADVYKNNKKQK